MNINKLHLIKYMAQCILVSLASYILSPCKIKCTFAFSLGLISSTIFVILDNFYPMIVIEKNDQEFIYEH